VVHSRDILSDTPGIAKLRSTSPPSTMNASTAAAIRSNSKDRNVVYGQMASIVDVYDAITSDRCYHKGMEPTVALRKMFEWSKFHFNPNCSYLRAQHRHLSGRHACDAGQAAESHRHRATRGKPGTTAGCASFQAKKDYTSTGKMWTIQTVGKAGPTRSSATNPRQMGIDPHKSCRLDLTSGVA